jgi:hypothetical protein
MCWLAGKWMIAQTVGDNVMACGDSVIAVFIVKQNPIWSAFF